MRQTTGWMNVREAVETTLGQNQELNFDVACLRCTGNHGDQRAGHNGGVPCFVYTLAVLHGDRAVRVVGVERICRRPGRQCLLPLALV